MADVNGERSYCGRAADAGPSRSPRESVRWPCEAGAEVGGGHPHPLGVARTWDVRMKRVPSLNLPIHTF